MALEEDKRQQDLEFTTPPDRFSIIKTNSINWDYKKGLKEKNSLFKDLVMSVIGLQNFSLKMVPF